MNKEKIIHMTWSELFDFLSKSSAGWQPYTAAAALQEALQAIMAVRLPELTLTVTANPADTIGTEFWVTDILLTPSANNPIVQAMAPFALCQTELFHVPGLVLFQDTGTAWEYSFSCDGDRRQLLNRPISEWADDVVSRGIRGSIRVRYLDPLISLCDCLEKLPPKRRELFLAYCTHLSTRYEPLAAPVLESGIPHTFEAKDALYQFSERLGHFDEKDYIVPRGVDPQEMRNSSWLWFQKAVTPWLGDYNGRVTTQQNAQALFSGLWNRLTSGSRGPGFYTGTPRSFYIASVYFDKSGARALKEFPLMGTRQVLGLLFEELPSWVTNARLEPATSREDIVTQMKLGEEWASRESLPMVRRTCLVMDWRDGSGVQFADLAFSEQNIAPNETKPIKRQRRRPIKKKNNSTRKAT